MEKLIEQLKAVDAKINALLAHDSLTDEQHAEYDALQIEYKACQDKIDREEDRLKRAADIAAREAKKETEERAAAVPSNRKTQANPPTATRKDAAGRVTGTIEATDEQINLAFGDSPEAKRQLSYREAKAENARFLKNAGYQPWGGFKSATEFVREGLASAGSHKFEEKVHGHFAAVQGMSEGVGADGGYTVMPEFSNRIIDRVYSNDLWSRTDNYTVTGNNMTFIANAETSRATGSRHGGLRGYWIPEGGSVTSSKPTLRQVSLKLVKLGVVVYLTQELIDDGGLALQEYIGRKASEEFNFLIGDSLINGTGVGQPLGLLNAPSLVSVAKESSQQAATLQTENITKMYARFYAGNRSRMLWLHNQDIEPQLFTMTLGIGAAGVATYLPPGALASTPNATLMGKPMLPTEFNATLGTQGDLIAADMSQMLSISKGGVAQAVSMHVQFLADQLALRFILRLNAGPWESAPITPYKGSSNTQSSFVTLDTRA